MDIRCVRQEKNCTHALAYIVQLYEM